MIVRLASKSPELGGFRGPAEELDSCQDYLAGLLTWLDYLLGWTTYLAGLLTEPIAIQDSPRYAAVSLLQVLVSAGDVINLANSAIIGDLEAAATEPSCFDLAHILLACL